MAKILFLYNDLNDIKGISTVMQVAERFAMNSDKGKFWVNTHPSPSIKFEEGTVLSVKPISKSLNNIGDYDEVYIDETINTFMETNGMFSARVEFYNKDSFKK